MNNIGITEGMGKKIVEALKKQNEPEVQIIQTEDEPAIELNSESEIEFVHPEENDEIEQHVSEGISNNISAAQQEAYIPQASSFNNNITQNIPLQQETQIQNQKPQDFTQSGMSYAAGINIDTSNMDFEMPANVAILKQLITQLPAGVTKQTGAQIIKQTMEALGISMKSVLQEAQQVQEGLNNSSRECQTNIIEYKKQIALLEKQTQTYQKQYAILNDIISLFIQTNNY